MWYRFETSEEFGADDVRATADGLLRLKDYLGSKEGIAPRRIDNLLIGTWNIKEFGGVRDQDAVQYIAEVVERFDIVAIQEVREDLSGLRDLMSCLGSWYGVFYTDVTRAEGGPEERMAFVYDTRKVEPTGLIGEVVMPPEAGVPSEQLVRTPMVIGFRCGWFTFHLCVVHILYGKGIAELTGRVLEIEAIAQAMAEHATKNPRATTILLGDFNIFSTGDTTFTAITKAGFKVPAALQKLPTSVGKTRRHYDQIAIHSGARFTPEVASAGVPDLLSCVYRDEDESLYAERMGEMYSHNTKGKPRPATGKGSPKWYYTTHWRARRLSDHLPMYVELLIDDSTSFVRRHASTP